MSFTYFKSELLEGTDDSSTQDWENSSTASTVEHSDVHISLSGRKAISPIRKTSHPSDGSICVHKDKGFLRHLAKTLKAKEAKPPSVGFP